MIIDNLLESIDPDLNYFDASDGEFSGATSGYFSVSEFNEFLKSSSKFTCVNHNIRSCNKNLDSFLSIFEKPENFPEVIVLTETWFETNFVINIHG